MSFNASFGDVIEDSNVILTDVNANNNNIKIVNSEIPVNNLSFDGLDNLNSNNNDKKIMKKLKIQIQFKMTFLIVFQWKLKMKMKKFYIFKMK